MAQFMWGNVSVHVYSALLLGSRFVFNLKLMFDEEQKFLLDVVLRVYP